MNYALLIDAIQVGPFTTHIAATVFAEQNGFDNYSMIELYDPAEAPGLIRRLNLCSPLRRDRSCSGQFCRIPFQACR